jgi:hypothetical protein
MCIDRDGCCVYVRVCHNAEAGTWRFELSEGEGDLSLSTEVREDEPMAHDLAGFALQDLVDRLHHWFREELDRNTQAYARHG